MQSHNGVKFSLKVDSYFNETTFLRVFSGFALSQFQSYMNSPSVTILPHCGVASKEFQQQSKDQMRKQQLKFKRKAIFLFERSFHTQQHQERATSDSYQEVYRAGSFLVSLSPGALYKRAAAGHNTPRHSAIMRCTRPLTTPTAGVSFVHSRRSRRSSLGDNLVPAFTGAVRSSVRCTPQQLLTTQLCRLRSSKNLRLPRLSSNPA